MVLVALTPGPQLPRLKLLLLTRIAPTSLMATVTNIKLDIMTLQIITLIMKVVVWLRSMLPSLLVAALVTQGASAKPPPTPPLLPSPKPLMLIPGSRAPTLSSAARQIGAMLVSVVLTPGPT